jgi:uncharacterized Tic20 family protein
MSPDLVTGDARIDACLRALDAALAGAASVRRQTVMEARDFLLESRDHARAEGLDANAAADRAIETLGDIRAIASEQRSRLSRLFRRTGLALGVTYATLMLGFSLLQGRPDPGLATLAVVFVLQALFFGGVMGYLAAYVFKRAEPKASDSEGPDHFRVAYTLTGIRISWALVLAFALMMVIIAAGLFGAGPFAASSPWWILALLLVDLRVILGALRAAWFRAEAKGESIVIEGLGGRTTIARAAIARLHRDPPPMQLLVPGLGLSWCITWQGEDGRTRRTRISINQDLVHGDRLLAWLEDAARANAPRLATAT